MCVYKLINLIKYGVLAKGPNGEPVLQLLKIIDVIEYANIHATPVNRHQDDPVGGVLFKFLDVFKSINANVAALKEM